MVWTVTLPYAYERLFSPGSQLSKGILWLEDGKQMGSQLLPAPQYFGWGLWRSLDSIVHTGAGQGGHICR